MGRRASDFTLEILHGEIKQAVAAALEPILPRLDELQARLDAANPGSPPAEDPFSEIDRMRAELERTAREAGAPAPEEEELRLLRAELEEAKETAESLRRQLKVASAAAPGELEEAREAAVLLRRRLADLEEQAEQFQLQREHLEQARETYRQRLEATEQERLRLLDQDGRVEQLTQQLDQLGQELQRERQLRQELETHVQAIQADQDEALRSWQLERQKLLDERERLREGALNAQSVDMTMEAERARWSLESRSLQGEIDRLTSVQTRLEEQRRELEQTLKRERELLQHAQQRLEKLENADRDSTLRFEEREHQMEAELRRLREQVNSLNYRLTMAGTGSAGPSPEESRKLLDRIADAEAEMAQKDELIQQNYRELGELRSKLEAVQRQHYEMQASYDQLHDKWSQLVARQWTEHQAQQQPAAPPDKKSQSGWLFRPRGE